MSRTVGGIGRVTGVRLHRSHSARWPSSAAWTSFPRDHSFVPRSTSMLISRPLPERCRRCRSRRPARCCRVAVGSVPSRWTSYPRLIAQSATESVKKAVTSGVDRSLNCCRLSQARREQAAASSPDPVMSDSLPCGPDSSSRLQLTRVLTQPSRARASTSVQLPFSSAAAHQSSGALSTHAIGRPSLLWPQCGSSIEVSCPSCRTQIRPQRPCLPAQSPASPPGSPRRHGLVVAVLERLEAGAQLHAQLRLRRLHPVQRRLYPGSDSTDEMTSPASAKALVRACRRTLSCTRRSAVSWSFALIAPLLLWLLPTRVRGRRVRPACPR